MYGSGDDDYYIGDGEIESRKNRWKGMGARIGVHERCGRNLVEEEEETLLFIHS